MSHLVLVVNSGSSSMKYQLVDPDAGAALATGLIERVGTQDGVGTHKADGETVTFTGPVPDHGAALAVMQQLFADAGTPLDQVQLLGVGHRVVNGGSRYGEPVVVDDEVLHTVRHLSPLAPLHNPANATGIEQARLAFPGIPQVAVFDTAFFRDLPEAAATYAIDREVAAAHRIKRYGAHGTSHQYVSQQVTALLGPQASARQIVLHLGNGASASAIHDGRAVDTSMGLTPLEGLVMGTRSGDIDPAVVFHLHRAAGMDVDAIDSLLNRRSGMLGLTGTNDLRDVHQAIAGDDPDRSAQAVLALDVYCRRIRKYVGAYLAVLGGVDAITFTAGVGENDAVTRSTALGGLERLGIMLDPERNAVRSGQARVISAEGSAVTVLVVPTNEELAIARATVAVLT